MRILAVNHTSRVSGAELSLLEVLAVLGAHDQVRLLTPAGELADRARNMGIEVSWIPSFEFGFRLGVRTTFRAARDWVAVTRIVRREARRFRPDVLRAASLRAMLVSLGAGAVAATRVVDARDVLPSSRGASAVKLFTRAWADTIVFNSKFTACRFGRTWPARRVVSYPMVSVHELLTMEMRSPRVDEPTVGMIGQITPWKGHADAIEALAILQQTFPRARLEIFGSVVFSGPAVSHDNDEFLRGLESEADSRTRAESVRFAGRITDLGRALSGVDVLVVPSWVEPFGRVVVEAMAAGVPVVATSRGGPSEVIVNGVNGMLVPPRSAIGLAHAVRTLLEQPDLYRRIQVAGRGRAAELMVDRDLAHEADRIHRPRSRVRLRDFRRHPGRRGRPGH